jgi:hypothetical protein
MSLLVVGLAILVCALVGERCLSLVRGGGQSDFLFDCLTGLVALHLLLVLLQAAGLAWSPLTVVLPMVGVALARRRLPRGSWPPSTALGWGDATALLALFPLAVLALLGRIAAPDFVYHWGLKARKFLAAGGVDWSFLGEPWNAYAHPDYPHLLPELMAVTASVEGQLREGSMLLWSVVLYGLVLLAARRLATRCVESPSVRQITLAVLALSLLGFVVSWQMTGNADVLMSLAVLAGSLCLLETPTRETDYRAGVVAAFAAAGKIEGVPLAGIFLVLYLSGRLWCGRDWRSLGRCLALPALVIGTWTVQCLRHELFQGTNAGPLLLERLPTVARSVLFIAAHDGWHGVSLLSLGLIPILLFAAARHRTVVLMCTLQLGFYLTVYLTAPVDTEFLIITSFPRLMMHLIPTLLVVAAGVVGRWGGTAPAHLEMRASAGSGPTGPDR